MNLDNIRDLIQDDEVREAVMQIIEFEQSQLHKTQPRYKDKYRAVIEEAVNEN